jgi:hypothetical protein
VTRILRFALYGLCALTILVQAAGSPSPSAVKEIKIPAGQTADLWLGINVTGKVNYIIRTRDGKNAMRMWWIMEPLGTVKQLGTLVNSGSLDIPNKLKGSISAKLRGKAAVDTVVHLGENVSVDSSMTFNW